MSASRTARRSDVSDLNWNRFTTRRLCPRDCPMLCRLFMPRLPYPRETLTFFGELINRLWGEGAFMFSSLKKERIRILLIEEEVLVRDGLKALIASWGFNVGELANSGQVSEDILSFQPDVVLL